MAKLEKFSPGEKYPLYGTRFYEFDQEWINKESLHGRFKPRLCSHCITDVRALLWFYHTVRAAILLCKYTAGGVTALNEIHTIHLHHSVMIAACTWLVSTRSTASCDTNITIHKRNTNIQEYCTLLNPLLV